jgi:uncharacterized phage-associated protein
VRRGISNNIEKLKKPKNLNIHPKNFFIKKDFLLYEVLKMVTDVKFDMEKFKEVLHYVIHKCGHLENVGKTVLFKILYFLDFDYYELFEEPLTGESYRKLEHGPAPVHFDRVVKELENEDIVEICDIEIGKYTQHKYISLKEPKLDLLTGNELKIIDEDIARYSTMNATRISEFSHGDLPYKATRDGEIIDYELVFYRDSLFSAREYEDE